MTTAPIDYAPRRRTWRRWRRGVIIAAGLLFLLSLPGLPVRRVESRIDAVTGTMTWTTRWPFGLTTGPRVDVSPLELRLKRSRIQSTPAWRTLHITHRNLIGRATCYECSSAPAIYRLRPVLEEFAAAATDVELTDFVRVMQSGTEEEQEAAVEAAAGNAFHFLETGRRGS